MNNMVELGKIEKIHILGLDQDSHNIGWAIGKGPDYVTSGLVTFKGGREIRLEAIYRWVVAVLIHWRPAFYVLEAPMGDHENIDTHKLLGEVMGICKAAGYETRNTPMVITPYWIKATGYSKGTCKEAAILAGKPKVSGHEADAIGAWLAGWICYRNLEIEKRLVDSGLTERS